MKLEKEIEKQTKVTSGAKTLVKEVLQYIADNSTNMESEEDITNLIKHKALSDAEVAALVLPFEDKGLNAKVEKWIFDRTVGSDTKALVDIATLYGYDDVVSNGEEGTFADLASALLK